MKVLFMIAGNEVKTENNRKCKAQHYSRSDRSSAATTVVVGPWRAQYVITAL